LREIIALNNQFLEYTLWGYQFLTKLHNQAQFGLRYPFSFGPLNQSTI